MIKTLQGTTKQKRKITHVKYFPPLSMIFFFMWEKKCRFLSSRKQYNLNDLNQTINVRLDVRKSLFLCVIMNILTFDSLRSFTVVVQDIFFLLVVLFRQKTLNFTVGIDHNEKKKIGPFYWLFVSKWDL